MTLMWFCAGVVAIKLVVLAVYATRLWLREPSLWELALIWLLPFYGALYVICLRAAVPAALAQQQQSLMAH